jgi:hypothetical protein
MLRMLLSQRLEGAMLYLSSVKRYVYHLYSSSVSSFSNGAEMSYG